MLVEQRRRLIGAVDHEDALAVVAAPGRLQHHRPAVGGREPGHVFNPFGTGPGRLRLAGGIERTAQHELVLRVDEGGRTGGDPEAGVLEGVQVLGRHVLVVEGEHRGALGQRLEIGEAAVVPEPDVGGHESGGLGGIGGQHPQGLAERDGSLMGHPGQLPAADHRHDGQAGTRIERRRPWARQRDDVSDPVRPASRRPPGSIGAP